MRIDSERDIPAEVSEALLMQDRALSLLERLRSEEPFMPDRGENPGGGRRDFRRWPTPPGVVVELHDEILWRVVNCLDLGVGGARIEALPKWVRGPVPVRLSAPGIHTVIVLADVMWKAPKENHAGLRFEFQDEEERDVWSGGTDRRPSRGPLAGIKQPVNRLPNPPPESLDGFFAKRLGFVGNRRYHNVSGAIC